MHTIGTEEHEHGCPVTHKYQNSEINARQYDNYLIVLDNEPKLSFKAHRQLTHLGN